MPLPELQNCLALVAEVTAEAWLLSSDFRTAVPNLFFSSPHKTPHTGIVPAKGLQ